ncbi:MAG: ABC transporter permease [Hungatella hathewayi]|nr:ABC transporter permease [Hungatella hathewayi]
MNSLHNVLFYPRLAVTSMKKNRGIYLPYLMAGGVMAGLLYVLDSVGVMVEASQMAGGGIMQVIVEICGSICTVFAVMILFYINSFVMKRRKKEFGLFCVLGMEKKHLGFVLFWEVLIALFVSLVMGITVGALFSQAMFLLLLKMVGLPGKLMFVIPLQSVGKTCLIYVAAFALVLVYDLGSVFKANPMELLRSSAQGEREPKTRWLMTVTGVVTLGFGYFLAMSTGTASDALTFFFPAVLFVMVGTYCLFQAGSVAALKKLRRKKDFYYKPENFAAVSGMIYRMKQNAAGLAGICILSAAVLITMSTCASLYVGEEDILRNQYPRDIALFAGAGEEVNPTGEVPGTVKTAAENLAREHGCELENMMDFYQMSFNGEFEDGSFTAVRNYNVGTWMVYVMTLEDYNRNNGGNETLAEGEMLYYAPELPLPEEVAVCGETYRVAGMLKEFAVNQLTGFATPQDQVLLIVPELSDLHRLFRAYSEQLGEDARETISYHCLFDLAGSPEGKAGFEAEFQERIPGLNRGVARDEIRTEFYQLYGSILFVGIFFVALFLTATVLIIYYKQITEGYDDRERFRIMEKVGMSGAEVKKTITRQVIMVFFLPLGVAVIHILAAFRAMCSLLRIFSMHNVGLYAVFTACSVLVFGVVYLAVYCVTARTYYRIVRE